MLWKIRLHTILSNFHFQIQLFFVGTPLFSCIFNAFHNLQFSAFEIKIFTVHLPTKNNSCTMTWRIFIKTNSIFKGWIISSRTLSLPLFSSNELGCWLIKIHDYRLSRWFIYASVSISYEHNTQNLLRDTIKGGWKKYAGNIFIFNPHKWMYVCRNLLASIIGLRAEI